MSWLNSFDPAAPKGSYGASSSGSRNALGPSRSVAAPAGLHGSTAGPSAAPPGPSRPAQIGRTTRLNESTPYSGPSRPSNAPPAYAPRPIRPPHRIKAAPPSAALRSEDAQPNEHQMRTKPWEIEAPPTIGKAKTAQPICPPRKPSQPRPKQARTTGSQRAPLPVKPPSAPAPKAPQRPTQPPSGPQAQPKPRHPPPTAEELQKKELKRLRREEHERNVLAKRQRQSQAAKKANEKKKKWLAQSTEAKSPAAKKEEIEMPDMELSEAAKIRLRWEQSSSSSSDSAMERTWDSRGRRTPSPPPLPSSPPTVLPPPSMAAPQPSLPTPTAASNVSIVEAHLQSQAPSEPKSAMPTLAQLRGILSAVEKSTPPIAHATQEKPKASEISPAGEIQRAKHYAQPTVDSSDVESVITPPASPRELAPAMRKAFEVPARALRPSKRGVKAEQVDYKASSTQQLDPPTQAASSKAIETDNISDDDDDDDDDRPLAAALQASGRLSNLSSKPRQPETCVDSDPDEDVPLQDLLQRRSAEPATASTDTRPKWPSTPFEPKLKKAFAGAHGLSIKYFVPLASAALAGRDAAPTRSRAAMFDSALAVSEHGRIVTYAEECDRDVKPDDLPSRFLHLAERPVDKKSVKGSSPIDRVEDVVRLTSKVCAIASSTDQPLGLGNHSDYPVQVSLVTLDASRSARTHHLDERPHAWGASSITSFPRTDPFNSGSVDFATGGIDGVVHHWNWSRPTTTTSRLHTLHGSKPVVALEHLPSRTTLASASLGSVIGFDLSALTLGFSWNTSDHIVHLERTPDPKLMLGVLARRDYDQFRLFDVTGGNGPVSRPVLRFGWLNEAQGSLPLGRGAWHPHRRAMFAHAAEDGHVRVWDMRNARDALVDVDLEEEALVDVVWAAEGEEDVMYVAGTRGVRCVALVPP